MGKYELTVFFTKPHISDLRKAGEIINYLEAKTGCERFLRTTAKPGSEFWRDFYAPVREGLEKEADKRRHQHKKVRDIAKGLKQVDEMVESFGSSNNLTVLIIYIGEDVVRRVREAVGNRLYEKCEEGTIRIKYGNPKMGYETIVHASDQDSVRHDFEVLVKHRLIGFDPFGKDFSCFS